MYSRTFENLDDVVRESHSELCTYRDILEISDRVKNTAAEKGVWQRKREYSKSVATFLKKNEAN